MAMKLFASMGLTICAIVFLTLIFIVYLSKKKFKAFDSGVFLFMFIMTYLILADECLYIYAMYAELDAHISFIPVNTLCYAYIYLCIIWFIGMIVYIFSKIKSDKALEVLKKTKTIRTILLLGTAVILFVTAGLLPIEYPAGNSHLYVFAGPAVYVLYIIAIISLLIVTGGAILRRKNIPDYQKYPIYFCLAMLITINILQLLLNYDWNSLSFLFSFVIITLYFTLESQDYRLIHELEQKSKEAELADEAKTQFLSNMSHEIRTPLNTILNISHVLMYEDQITEDQIQKEGKMIYNASEELHEIINNILDISSVESEKLLVENSEYHMNDLIYIVDNSIKNKVNADKINYKIDVNPEVIKQYNGDLNKISKMLIYVANSIMDSMDYGILSIQINGNTISTNEETIQFDINSTTSKINNEEFQSLFNNFKTISTQTPQKENRINLELIVAREFLDLLQGSFESVDTTEGIHYIFTIKQAIINN